MAQLDFPCVVQLQDLDNAQLPFNHSPMFWPRSALLLPHDDYKLNGMKES